MVEVSLYFFLLMLAKGEGKERNRGEVKADE